MGVNLAPAMVVKSFTARGIFQLNFIRSLSLALKIDRHLIEITNGGLQNGSVTVVMIKFDRLEK